MSDEQQSAPEPTQVEEGIPLAQFLESVSPGQVRKVITLLITTEHADPMRIARFNFTLPEIQLHCPSDVCNRERFFLIEEDDRVNIRGNDWNFE